MYIYISIDMILILIVIVIDMILQQDVIFGSLSKSTGRIFSGRFIERLSFYRLLEIDSIGYGTRQKRRRCRKKQQHKTQQGYDERECHTCIHKESTNQAQTTEATAEAAPTSTTTTTATETNYR